MPFTRDELPKKDWVVGAVLNKKAYAFPLKSLAQNRKAELEGIRITYDPESRLATARDPDGKEIPTVTVFWFAWQAFHPETALWKP